jgi:hypothetical protein
MSDLRQKLREEAEEFTYTNHYINTRELQKDDLIEICPSDVLSLMAAFAIKKLSERAM